MTMESRASARFVRVTPMKARRVVNLIRGLSAREAQLCCVLLIKQHQNQLAKC